MSLPWKEACVKYRHDYLRWRHYAERLEKKLQTEKEIRNKMIDSLLAVIDFKDDDISFYRKTLDKIKNKN